MINILTKEQLSEHIKRFQLPHEVDESFLYDVYETSINGINTLNESNIFGKLSSINQYELINYCLGEVLYITAPMPKEEQVKYFSNEDNVHNIASIVADKYLSLSLFNYKERKLMNKYLPPVSTLNLYLNFILNILNTYQQNEPRHTLIRDLLSRSCSIARNVLSSLVDGYATEAFATWRTLHECECTLVVLEKYKEPVIERYLRHMTYGIAYKNGLPSKEETDKIFVEIKEGMASHGLKSKDMKKYIEYGWLYAIDVFKENPEYKLNFKDGLEKISGVEGYGDAYNLSSEIVHATPMLIYPNKDYFYYATLLSLYEAFFRLESSFFNLLFTHISKENGESYLRMRNMYYSHLINIYKREKDIFKKKNFKS